MLESRARCRRGHRCQPNTLAEVLAHVTQHADLGLSDIALRVWATLGDPRATATFVSWFRKVCSPYDPARLPLDHVAAVCHAAGSTELVEFVAREAGGVFVRVPDVRPEHGDILQAHLAAVREFGEHAEQLARMLADGVITGAESVAFDHEIDETVQRLLELKPLVRAHAREGRIAV